ncbi:MAG: peptide chain release factor 1 [Anaerolineae bacterium]
MLDKLAGVEARYEEIERLLADPAVMADYERVTTLAKERSEIYDIVMTYRDYRKKLADLEGAKELAYSSDAEIAQMAKLEVDTLTEETEALYDQLKTMLLPKDPRDGKDVIMEIRAGTGGDEAGLFAADLLRMYLRYAERKKWKTEIVSLHETGGGVIKSVTVMIKGDNVFSRLKYESGVHRVQRVPATESQGRIHTSTATVAVLAEIDEVEVNLDMNDVRVDVFRSQGAGGQSVNTTDSAVRMTHIPTGIVVEVQDERKQLQNRIRAKQILIARLYELEMEKLREQHENERRSQIGSGERSEKIRTYNYPQGRVTDHRIGYSSYNLPAVMDGDIDDFIDQLATQAQAEQLAAGVKEDD